MLTQVDIRSIIITGGDKMLTRKQLAEYMQVSERTIDRYREQGMPFHKLPTGSIRFKLEEVEKWMKG